MFSQSNLNYMRMCKFRHSLHTVHEYMRISNNRQHNCQKKEYKRTNNDLQNIRIKLQIETRTPLSVYDKWTASFQQETIDLTEFTDTLFAYKNSYPITD
jgi:hypothetical protein